MQKNGDDMLRNRLFSDFCGESGKFKIYTMFCKYKINKKIRLEEIQTWYITSG